MWIVMFVLDDPGRLDEILGAWEAAGIPGVTIVESTGFHRRRGRIPPMRFLFENPSDYVERGHYTLFVIVHNQAQAEQCLQSVEAIVGDLNQPHTGVFAAWPLALVKGLIDPDVAPGPAGSRSS